MSKIIDVLNTIAQKVGPMTDYTIETGQTELWRWRKFAGGLFVAEEIKEGSFTTGGYGALGNFYGYYNLTVPDKIFDLISAYESMYSEVCGISTAAYSARQTINSNSTGITNSIMIISGAANTKVEIIVKSKIVGRWK